MLTGTLIVLGAAALTGLVWYLLRKAHRKHQQRERNERAQQAQRQAAAQACRQRDQAASQQAQEQRRQVEQAKREEQVQALLRADPLLARQLLMDTSYSDCASHQILTDPDAIRDITNQVSQDKLAILTQASQEPGDFVSIKLESVRETLPVCYPTRRMEPAQLTDYGQLPNLMPEELLLPDELFDLGLATSSLITWQAYDESAQQRRLYLLLDVSGSMDGRMRSGQSRRIWALGLACSMLIRAVHGEASYLFRTFQDRPGPLRRAEHPAEAEALLSELVRTHSGGGGTDIMAALQAAAADMGQTEQDFVTSDILLISDGESRMSTASLKQLLGTTTRLHVALIGATSDMLRQVATTYNVYS